MSIAIPSTKLTYPLLLSTFEDEFRFQKVGYGGFKQGLLKVPFLICWRGGVKLFFTSPS